MVPERLDQSSSLQKLESDLDAHRYLQTETDDSGDKEKVRPQKQYMTLNHVPSNQTLADICKQYLENAKSPTSPMSEVNQSNIIHSYQLQTNQQDTPAQVTIDDQESV